MVYVAMNHASESTSSNYFKVTSLNKMRQLRPFTHSISSKSFKASKSLERPFETLLASV